MTPESIVRIELFGLLVERMDEQGAHTGVLRHGYGPMNRVLQQPGAELDALGAVVNRQPCNL